MAIDNNTPPLYFEHFYSLKEWSENKLNYRFNRDYNIERHFETWIENQGCYADRETEEYKHWLTLDNLKRFTEENPNVIAAKLPTTNQDKTFKELWNRAMTYELIQFPPPFDSDITKAHYENYLNFNFSVWLQKNKGLEYGNTKHYKSLCTWDNFLVYLKEMKDQEDLKKKQFEIEKQKYQNYIAPKTKSNANKVNVEKMKEYLMPSIFIKKGKQKSKADELVRIIQADRAKIEIAVIAKYIQQNHLLKDKYKHSLDWAKWLQIFYEISGHEKAYQYRINEIKNDVLELQLNALFPKPKNNK
jgi:hypothetical protein